MENHLRLGANTSTNSGRDKTTDIYATPPFRGELSLVFYESETDGEESPLIVKGAIRKLVTSKKAGAKNMNGLVITVARGGFVKEHNHEYEEIYYIESGQAKVTIEGKSADVSKGGMIFIPSNLKHEMTNTGDGPLRFVAVISPGRW